MSEDLMIPGKFSKERRVFHHTLSGDNLAAGAVLVNFEMDDLFVGSAAGPGALITPNPVMTHCCKLTHVGVDFIHGGAPPAGNWTLNIAANEAAVAAVTFSITATGAAVVHQKSHGPIDCFELSPGDSYWIWATGPAVNVALIRAILRFEEIGGP